MLQAAGPSRLPRIMTRAGSGSRSKQPSDSWLTVFLASCKHTSSDQIHLHTEGLTLLGRRDGSNSLAQSTVGRSKTAPAAVTVHNRAHAQTDNGRNRPQPEWLEAQSSRRLCDLTAWRISLPERVATPAKDQSVFANPTGMGMASAHGDEQAIGGYGLPVLVPTPATHGSVNTNPT